MMREKLFPRSILLIKTSFFLLFILPLISFAYGKGICNEIKDSTKIEKPLQISISKGTLIIGIENMHNIQVDNVTEVVKITSKKVPKSSLTQEINLALSEKKSKLKISEKSEEQGAEKKIDVVFTGNPDGNSNYSKKSPQFFTAIFSPFNVLQKAAIVYSDAFQLANVKLAVKKQKLSTSLSYLQFGKYRSSSLRAPPFFTKSFI